MMESHPHDLLREIPDRLPIARLRELSQIDPARAVSAIAAEWAGVIAALLAYSLWPSWWLWALLVPWVGARQAAMAVLVHDAVHFRLFRDRRVNDLVAKVFCAWPIFMTVAGFRYYHSDHHRFTNMSRDGNRKLWGTHRAGVQVPEWQYPTTRLGLARRLAWRACGPTGLWWIFRGIVGTFRIPAPASSRAAIFLAYVVGAAALTALSGWATFFWLWVFPLCTWQVFVQYVRLIMEHSAIPERPGEYAFTRSTIPGLLGALFVLPLNVGYHIEHHWYPSVPLYRLPELHAALLEQPGFTQHAVIHRSIWSSLSECVRG